METALVSIDEIDLPNVRQYAEAEGGSCVEPPGKFKAAKANHRIWLLTVPNVFNAKLSGCVFETGSNYL